MNETPSSHPPYPESALLREDYIWHILHPSQQYYKIVCEAIQQFMNLPDKDFRRESMVQRVRIPLMQKNTEPPYYMWLQIIEIPSPAFRTFLDRCEKLSIVDRNKSINAALRLWLTKAGHSVKT